MACKRNHNTYPEIYFGTQIVLEYLSQKCCKMVAMLLLASAHLEDVCIIYATVSIEP